MSRQPPLRQADVVQDFYRRLNYQPLWTENAVLRPAGERLLNQFERSGRHGLDPQDYLAGLSEARDGDYGELFLTDRLVSIASHLHAGRLEPPQDPKWGYPQRALDTSAFLDRVAQAPGGVADRLEELAPQHAEYRALQAVRAGRQQAAARAWPDIPAAGLLRPGQRHSAVPGLRERLARLGHLDVANAGDSAVFDPGLVAALKRFQRWNGLVDDGLLGPATRQLLDYDPARRQDLIDLNLDRYRWMSRRPDGPHVVVDVPDYSLTAFARAGQPVLTSRVIIGKQKPRLQTPLFAGAISYLVVNPYWNVPNTIATREILPKLADDPDHLASQGLEAVRGWGDDTEVIALAEVLAALPVSDDQPLDFRIRQKPGPDNSLGSIKFMFPNKFNVYLHDTPAKPLFSTTQRTYSHACVRVEKPLELALWALGEDWPRERLEQLVARRERRRVELANAIPVLLTYATARGTREGLQLRPDVYGRDQPYLRRQENSTRRH